MYGILRWSVSIAIASLPAKWTRRGLDGHHSQLPTPGPDGFQPLLYRFHENLQKKNLLYSYWIYLSTWIPQKSTKCSNVGKIYQSNGSYGMVILHPPISLVLQPAATSGPDHNGDLPETNSSQLKKWPKAPKGKDCLPTIFPKTCEINGLYWFVIIPLRIPNKSPKQPEFFSLLNSSAGFVSKWFVNPPLLLVDVLNNLHHLVNPQMLRDCFLVVGLLIPIGFMGVVRIFTDP